MEWGNDEQDRAITALCFTIIVGFIVAFSVVSIRMANRHQYDKYDECTLRRDIALPRQTGVHVLEIDGHKYLYAVGNRGCALTRKADCRACKWKE